MVEFSSRFESVCFGFGFFRGFQVTQVKSGGTSFQTQWHRFCLVFVPLRNLVALVL
jgi:hypothetical protein